MYIPLENNGSRNQNTGGTQHMSVQGKPFAEAVKTLITWGCSIVAVYPSVL